jgi:hypothetical protein
MVGRVLDYKELDARSMLLAARATVAPAMALAVAALVIYWALRKAILVSGPDPSRSLMVFVGTILAAIALRRTSYEQFPRFISIFLRFIGGALFIQMAFDAVNFSPATPNIFLLASDPVLGLEVAASLVVGVCCILRPSFLLAVIAYYIMFRISIEARTGLDVVPTDYEGMAETCLYGTVAALLVASPLGSWIIGLVEGSRKHLPLEKSVEIRSVAYSIIWAAMVGAHMRNYFYSGLAKLYAGESEPLSWLLHNATQTSILIGLERGDGPLSHAPGVLQGIWDTFSAAGPFINAVILGAQLFAPLAAFNKRILLALTIFYDIFHIGVYFTLGALFFFWILVNVLVFASAKHLPGKRLTMPMTVAMLLTIFFGGRFFYTNHLGWLDGAKLASTHFYAKTRDGRSVLIPGPFFGLYSYSIAQGRLFIPAGSFPLREGGNTRTLADWADAKTCGPIVTTADSTTKLSSVQHIVNTTDMFARAHPWFKSWNAYYYYPSHMVANPFDFAEFNKLSMNDIVGYTYRVDSVCLALKGGHLQRNVVKTWKADFPVPSSGAT